MGVVGDCEKEEPVARVWRGEEEGRYGYCRGYSFMGPPDGRHGSTASDMEQKSSGFS